MKTLITVLIGFVIVASATAQYSIKNSTFSNGSAKTANAEYSLRSITGINITGKSENAIYISYSGYPLFSSSLITALNDPFSDMPGSFQLYQNYPNPFNPQTNIKFALPQAANVKISVYNVLGQHLQTLLDETRPAGFHIVNFDANRFSSGMYFYAIQAGAYQKVMKMMLVK